MRAGSLCTGAGGLDLAIEDVFGAETAWQAEVDPHASTVLEKRWPGVPNLGDITAVDWSTVEPVDVLAGGTPCQDMSSAGRRAGMRDGTRSGLWVSMAEAIRVLRPQVVIWENVRGALSADADSDVESEPGLLGGRSDGPALRAAGRVVGDLAGLGYDAVWRVVAASDVGACHRRERVFVVAVAADAGRERLGELAGGPPAQEAGSVGRDLPRDHRGERALGDGWAAGVGDLLPTPQARDDHGIPGPGFNAGNLPREIALLPTVRTSDANGAGAHGDGGVDLRTAVTLLPTTTRYAEAIARHEDVFGRPAPDPTVPSKGGKPVLSHRFTEWMMGWPDGWVSDLLDRRPGLRASGNGVVPAQAAAAIRSLLPVLVSEVTR